MSRLETTEWIGWERSSRDRAGREKKKRKAAGQKGKRQKAKGQKELRGSFIFSSFPEMPDPQNYG
jgi:hypothetical protein